MLKTTLPTRCVLFKISAQPETLVQRKNSKMLTKSDKLLPKATKIFHLVLILKASLKAAFVLNPC